MKIKAVIFDLDGLMLDTEPAYRRAWTEAGVQLGFRIDESFYNSTIGIPNSEGERMLATHFGKAFPLEKFSELWKQLFCGYITAGDVSVKKGLEELIETVDKLGLKKAIATSSTKAEIGYNRCALQLITRFAVVTTCDEIAHAKPHPQIFSATAAKLGLSASQTLALEDSNNGMRSAIAAGCVSVMVPDMVKADDDVTKEAYKIVHSLLDVIPIVEKFA
jgi:HAD superfamily hydrolase (TIGR01509 family)